MPVVSRRRSPARLALLGFASLAMTGAGCAPAALQGGSPQAARTESNLADVLRARVGPPHEETIAAYVKAGAADARAHVLTDREWALVERAIAGLPTLHQRILEQRLSRLSFIDAPASSGTALTRSFDGPDGEPSFDITLRADVLETSLSDFLTRKEAMLFSEDGSGYSVQVSTGDAPALPYLLLHEASHVVDRTFGLTTDGRPFRDVWSDYLGLAEPWATTPLGVSTYRRGPPRPLADAPELYRALAASPFVSLYSTASAGEDFAELITWSHLSARRGVPLTVEVRDRDGRVLMTVEPLGAAAVQARLLTLNALVARADAARLPTPVGGPA